MPREHPTQNARPPMPATTTGRLLRLLRRLDEHQRSTLTNVQLAHLLSVSARTVNYALARLQQRGVISIERRDPHPVDDRTGRTIRLRADDESKEVQR